MYNMSIKNILSFLNILNDSTIYFENNDNIIEKTEYINGLKNGNSYTYYYNSNNLFKEEFYVNGLLNGVVKYFYKNGIEAYTLNYENGLINGPIKIYNDKGLLLIDGFYSDNQLNNLLYLYNNGKLLLKCEFKNNKLNGISKILTNKYFYIIEYNENIKNGIFKKYNVANKLFKKLNNDKLNILFNDIK